MIASLKGHIQAVSIKQAIIVVNDVGYRVNMPLSDLTRLSKNQPHFFHIYTHVKEDALELYGFLEENRLTLFEHLISVSGIGPKMALGILSGVQADELRQCISSGEYQRLTRIPGIGAKTAQRLVLELRDKIAKFNTSLSLFDTDTNHVLQDLRSAIANLGYKTQSIDKAIRAVEPLAQKGEALESLLKEALRHL